jgi:predicted transcriptional regulator
MEEIKSFLETKRHGDLKEVAKRAALSYQTVYRWKSGVRVRRDTETKIVNAIQTLQQ